MVRTTFRWSKRTDLPVTNRSAGYNLNVWIVLPSWIPYLTRGIWLLLLLWGNLHLDLSDSRPSPGRPLGAVVYKSIGLSCVVSELCFLPENTTKGDNTTTGWEQNGSRNFVYKQYRIKISCLQSYYLNP